MALVSVSGWQQQPRNDNSVLCGKTVAHPILHRRGGGAVEGEAALALSSPPHSESLDNHAADDTGAHLSENERSQSPLVKHLFLQHSPLRR